MFYKCGIHKFVRIKRDISKYLNKNPKVIKTFPEHCLLSDFVWLLHAHQIIPSENSYPRTLLSCESRQFHFQTKDVLVLLPQLDCYSSGVAFTLIVKHLWEKQLLCKY
jgi:hypothetical protein